MTNNLFYINFVLKEGDVMRNKRFKHILTLIMFAFFILFPFKTYAQLDFTKGQEAERWEKNYDQQERFYELKQKEITNQKKLLETKKKSLEQFEKFNNKLNVLIIGILFVGIGLFISLFKKK